MLYSRPLVITYFIFIVMCTCQPQTPILSHPLPHLSPLVAIACFLSVSLFLVYIYFTCKWYHRIFAFLYPTCFTYMMVSSSILVVVSGIISFFGLISYWEDILHRTLCWFFLYPLLRVRFPQVPATGLLYVFYTDSLGDLIQTHVHQYLRLITYLFLSSAQIWILVSCIQPSTWHLFLDES